MLKLPSVTDAETAAGGDTANDVLEDEHHFDSSYKRACNLVMNREDECSDDDLSQSSYLILTAQDLEEEFKKNNVEQQRSIRELEDTDTQTMFSEQLDKKTISQQCLAPCNYRQISSISLDSECNEECESYHHVNIFIDTSRKNCFDPEQGTESFQEPSKIVSCSDDKSTKNIDKSTTVEALHMKKYISAECNSEIEENQIKKHRLEASFEKPFYQVKEYPIAGSKSVHEQDKCDFVSPNNQVSSNHFVVFSDWGNTSFSHPQTADHVQKYGTTFIAWHNQTRAQCTVVVLADGSVASGNKIHSSISRWYRFVSGKKRVNMEMLLEEVII